jgi:hypothetical protein
LKKPRKNLPQKSQTWADFHFRQNKIKSSFSTVRLPLSDFSSSLTISDSILQEMPSSDRKSAANPTSQKNVDVAEMRAEFLGNEKVFQDALAQEIEDGVDSLDDSFWRSGRTNKRINYYGSLQIISLNLYI